MRQVSEIVHLRNPRLYFTVLQGRIMRVSSKRPSHIHHMVDRMAITTDEERIEGDTLHVGAWGIVRIMKYVGERKSYRTPKAFGLRMDALFSGDIYRAEMLAGTVRAGLEYQNVSGEAAYWMEIAQRQLAWRPQDTDEFEFEVETIDPSMGTLIDNQ